MRSSTWIVLGHLMEQGVRLGSNLILTRLLFPEAFGLMALIMVFIMGLTMFSDIGVGPSIQQSKRGDDPDFLNTAWTIQIIRGGVLWVACCLIAYPVSILYDEPLLLQALPIAGLSLLVIGFEPTRVETATRHLLMGRVTILSLISQLISVTISILLAWYMQSVWALVISGVIGSVVSLFFMHVFLPGLRNSIRWERTSLHELVTFGRWIFLSTLSGFILSQGDKAILAKYLTLESLGIYNIGFVLASFPLGLAFAVVSRIMIPLYREKPPGDSAANFNNIRRLRYLMTAAVMTLQIPFAFLGVEMINFLYDERFIAAGAVVTALACINMPIIVGMTYEPSALAAGDSRSLFFLQATKAAVQTVLFLIGVHYFGLTGALVGQGVTMLLIYPMVVWIARKHKAWDPLHDAIWLSIGLSLGGLALWMNRESLEMLTMLPTG